jgi:hypothetical protein
MVAEFVPECEQTPYAPEPRVATRLRSRLPPGEVDDGKRSAIDLEHDAIAASASRDRDEVAAGELMIEADLGQRLAAKRFCLPVGRTEPGLRQ